MRDGGDILALGKNLAQAMKKITTGNGLVRHELWLDSKTERRFRLRDFWESHVGFEAFRSIHQLDCDRFDQLIAREELVAREEFLGAFYVNDFDSDEGDDLVPS